MVNLIDKKIFLKWFLAHYQLKKRESLWILNYILNHEELLNTIHFVENALKTPRGLAFSTVDTDHVAFEYNKFGKLSTNPELAFHDIRMDWQDAFYIELHFSNAYVIMNRYGVLEDNPYNDDNILEEETTNILYSVENELEKKYLLQEIDTALLKGDKEQFEKLIAKLDVLEKGG